ncbi:hypothetical protein [Xanthomonas phage OP1]|uniref:Uncharacterized protein n=1 Tax=Xanthomonas phage OP1 TaxID=2994040 RepID=Q2NPD4_9CAUD|nr:hypothetical protein OP1_ORF57 [Xanthomonas phage OP1]BAE72762.1 hypothetical protein [Xanthomonas phage OP1]
MCNSPFKASDFFIGEQFDYSLWRCQQVDFVAVGSIVVGDAVGAVGEYLDVHVGASVCGWCCFSEYKISRLAPVVKSLFNNFMNALSNICLTICGGVCEIVVLALLQDEGTKGHDYGKHDTCKIADFRGVRHL